LKIRGASYECVDCGLIIGRESPFTRSYQTPSNKAVLNPKSRTSYSFMLLIALKSRCTIYLN
jgi:hypothetical protein